MRTAEPLTTLRELTREPAWLVGGAVRDELLERPTEDFDLAVKEEPGPLAHRLARAMRGYAFELSESFGGWRVLARERDWRVDLLPVAGGSIEADLAARDLTVNAMAEPLAGGELLDPFGGVADVGTRQLRMVSRAAFDADPLRALRVARLACELGFTIEAATAAAAREVAPALGGVAPERVFAEIKRIVVSDRVLEGLATMDELSLTAVIAPELAALHGVEQSHYHHLDVHDHTRAVLAETVVLAADPQALLGSDGSEVMEVLAEPLADELSRGQALRLGALLHDVAKPQTRAVSAAGRITFFGHDETGAAVAAALLRRLRASERLCVHVAELVRHHLRLGFLVHEAPLSRRAIYSYLRSCGPVAVDVTLLSIADRLSTRGRGAEPAIARHLDLARQLLREALAWRREPPRPPLRGDELVRELAMVPGPRLGEVLAELQEAAFAGEIGSRVEALALAEALWRGGGGGDAESRGEGARNSGEG